MRRNNLVEFKLRSLAADKTKAQQPDWLDSSTLCLDAATRSNLPIKHYRLKQTNRFLILCKINVPP